MTPKRKRLWLVVGSLAVLGCAATLVLTALNDNIVFFYSPTQIAEKKIPPERRFRMGGLVEAGSVTKSTDGQVTSFKVTDTHKTVGVVYRGLLPDLFREGQGVIAEGSLGADGVSLRAKSWPSTTRTICRPRSPRRCGTVASGKTGRSERHAQLDREPPARS